MGVQTKEGISMDISEKAFNDLVKDNQRLELALQDQIAMTISMFTIAVEGFENIHKVPVGIQLAQMLFPEQLELGSEEDMPEFVREHLYRFINSLVLMCGGDKTRYSMQYVANWLDNNIPKTQLN